MRALLPLAALLLAGAAPLPTKTDACEGVYNGTASAGREYGACAAQEQAAAAAKRKAALARLALRLTPAQKRALGRLIAAEAAYVHALGPNEADLSGITWDGYFRIGEEEARHADFMTLIGRMRAGQPPKERDPDTAERAMNAAYRAKIEAYRLTSFDPETQNVTPEGLRATQRAWLAYRDAWLVFAAITYEGTSREALTTYLAKERSALVLRIPRSFEDEEGRGRAEPSP